MRVCVSEHIQGIVPRFRDLRFCTSEKDRRCAEAVWNIREHARCITVIRLAHKKLDMRRDKPCTYRIEILNQWNGEISVELAVNQKEVDAILQRFANELSQRTPCVSSDIPLVHELHFSYHPCLRRLKEVSMQMGPPFEVAWVYLKNGYAVAVLRGEPNHQDLYGIVIAADTDEPTSAHPLHIQTLFQELKSEYLVGWLNGHGLYMHLNRLANLPSLHPESG